MCFLIRDLEGKLAIPLPAPIGKAVCSRNSVRDWYTGLFSRRPGRKFRMKRTAQDEDH